MKALLVSKDKIRNAKHKLEIRNSKQIKRKFEIRISKFETNPNDKNSNDKRFNSEIEYRVKQLSKTYDLEDRTAGFAKETRLFLKLLPRTIANIEDIKQLVRSSGSVGAN